MIRRLPRGRYSARFLLDDPTVDKTRYAYCTEDLVELAMADEAPVDEADPKSLQHGIATPFEGGGDAVDSSTERFRA